MAEPPQLDKRYAISPEGILKVFELIMLITASACVMQYNTINIEPIPVRELFFLCVCLSGLVFIIFIYWLKLFQLDRVCCSQTSLWNVLIIFILFLMAVLCTIASSLLVILVHEHGDNNMWHFAHLLAAVVFCYVASVLFLADSVVGLYYLVKKIKGRKGFRETAGSFVIRNDAA